MLSWQNDQVLSSENHSMAAFAEGITAELGLSMSSVAVQLRIHLVDTGIAVKREECQPYSIVFRVPRAAP